MEVEDSSMQVYWTQQKICDGNQNNVISAKLCKPMLHAPIGWSIFLETACISFSAEVDSVTAVAWVMRQLVNSLGI